jgi:toxin ParE1/3/4
MAKTERALWSPEAIADFDDIWSYYDRIAGVRTADKIASEIAKAIALIEQHPFAGRSRNELKLGLRSIAATPHIVFYRVIVDAVEIARILDGRRDIDAIFAIPDE